MLTASGLEHEFVELSASHRGFYLDGASARRAEDFAQAGVVALRSNIAHHLTGLGHPRLADSGQLCNGSLASSDPATSKPSPREHQRPPRPLDRRGGAAGYQYHTHRPARGHRGGLHPRAYASRIVFSRRSSEGAAGSTTSSRSSTPIRPSDCSNNPGRQMINNSRLSEADVKLVLKPGQNVDPPQKMPAAIRPQRICPGSQVPPPDRPRLIDIGSIRRGASEGLEFDGAICAQISDLLSIAFYLWPHFRSAPRNR